MKIGRALGSGPHTLTQFFWEYPSRRLRSFLFHANSQQNLQDQRIQEMRQKPRRPVIDVWINVSSLFFGRKNLKPWSEADEKNIARPDRMIEWHRMREGGRNLHNISIRIVLIVCFSWGWVFPKFSTIVYFVLFEVFMILKIREVSQ